MKYHYQKGTLERDVAFIIMLYLMIFAMLFAASMWIKAYSLELHAKRCEVSQQ